MGFLDSIFGKEEKKEIKPIVSQHVDINEIIKAMEKTGANVGGEFGGLNLVKSLPLTNDIDVEAGRTELMKGNIVIFRIPNEILYAQNKERLGLLLSRTKQIVDTLHGDVNRVTEDNSKLLVVPDGVKIVKE